MLRGSPGGSGQRWLTVLLTSSSLGRLRGAADRAEISGSGTCPSLTATLQPTLLHLLPEVRKGKKGGAGQLGEGKKN